ncbi:hypothetical protein GJU39_17285 [Pedobacter petrophilus]|uniref:DinB-like domain-containing protein n=1 Tax=Pedobacter petrophilus TaxID=1908241 RepID=A0A7K0G3Q8_9SPHI|nr:DinB family protein [Pedobacter petrophilus]MRX77839.1 hypothetical protein [Pedobacter petrophilus]
MNITEKINELKENRLGLISIVKNLSIAQLNEIPAGYANNIIWNLGHILVTPAHHLFPGMENLLPVGEKYINSYSDGTKPTTNIGETEINEIIAYLPLSLDSLLQAHDAGLFTEDKGFGKRAFEGALDFLSFHERMHFSRIRAILAAIESN